MTLRANTGSSTISQLVSALAFISLLVCGSAEARVGESVCVKYGPCPLDLSAFICTDTPQSSFVRRVCYDASNAFMVIKLNQSWYPYCAIDAQTVHALLTAESVGSFYNKNIRSRSDGTRGPFDCRDHPMPSY